MIHVLLVSQEKNALAELADSLVEKNMRTTWADSGKDALTLISDIHFDLVVTDEQLSDMTGIEFAEKLVITNPMVNCVAVSALSHDDFHEATEGLGLMMQLPPNPGSEDAEALFTNFEKILYLTK